MLERKKGADILNHVAPKIIRYSRKCAALTKGFSFICKSFESPNEQHSTTNKFLFQPLLKFHVLAIVIVI